MTPQFRPVTPTPAPTPVLTPEPPVMEGGPTEMLTVEVAPIETPTIEQPPAPTPPPTPLLPPLIPLPPLTPVT